MYACSLSLLLRLAIGVSHALPTAHAVWLNTQNCKWFGSQISVICRELSGALTPNLTPAALPLNPAVGQKGLSSQTPCAL